MTQNLLPKLGLTFGLLLGACAAEDTVDTVDTVDTAQFAIDTDDNGAVDCTDLDHVVTCLHHPDAHVCAHADVNHNGVVDHEDLHDIYAGLAATGHHCTDPAHQDPTDHVVHH